MGPALYRDFDDHRSRPFHDLVARMGATRRGGWSTSAAGPGHLTGRVGGALAGGAGEALDASPDMVAAARENGVAAERADVATGRRAPDTDVVVTNAVLQWVPEHLDLLPAGSPRCRPGWFALQVPGNFGAPSHAPTASCSPAARRGASTLRRTRRCPNPGRTPSCSPACGADVDCGRRRTCSG